jgi:hypothetical protein
MLTTTQLIGFGSGGGGTDVTPGAIAFDDVWDQGFVASAATNVQTVSGIDTTITLRLSVSVAMSSVQTIRVYRSGVLVATASSGSFVDVGMTNDQTLQYLFTNSANFTEWTGTATLTNRSDGDAVLDMFTYYLYDTGSSVGVGVGVGVGGPLP